MPWTEDDAPSTAKTPKQRREWMNIANEELERTGDDGKAKHIANGVIYRRYHSSSGVGGTPGRDHGNRQFNAEDGSDE